MHLISVTFVVLQGPDKMLTQCDALPNQELSVLYGGPFLNYFLHMLRVNMIRDLAHMQLSDLQRKIKLDLYAERLTYREKESI